MNRPLSRRRFITISATAAGFVLTGGNANAALHRWRGSALGADAVLLLAHPDASEAHRLTTAAMAEISRLEKIFSLYRPDSAVSRLNRDGALVDPPPELVALLSECRYFAEVSGGAFDVTVQPLWRLYAEHFAHPAADPAGPPPETIARVLGLVDHSALEVDPARIALRRPGMGVTLNGIAQGYITDRVALLLRRRGLHDVLVNLGETRALGRHSGGRPWCVGLARAARTIDLVDSAMATSGGYGTTFDVPGRHHHILDPTSGRSARRYAAVSVSAPRATTADALSTAMSVMPPGDAAALLRSAAPAKAWLTKADGITIDMP